MKDKLAKNSSEERKRLIVVILATKVIKFGV
jgi:hypothetical protein